ncbi:hypothetical protein CYMTET_40123 [Cymbomonas tetramitiformis]|uniref:Uncharacterized protein n=1 Tax=Cymbomonas tetramitiformis TaxID=36881 RepID=A0AAE0F3J7_9CHLO|nr:hypothetical protein CYMTET_40123 [Cymbomonas tetramitiformis]
MEVPHTINVMAHTRIATQRVLVDASPLHVRVTLKKSATIQEIVAIDYDSVTPVVFATRADAGVQRDLFCLFRDFMTVRHTSFVSNDVHRWSGWFWYSLKRCALNSARHFLYACLQNGALQGTPVSDTIMDRVCAVVHPHNGMFNELDLIKTARHDIYTNALRRLTYSPECFAADDRRHVRWFRRHGVVYLHAFADLARITDCETMRSRARQFLRVGRDALNAYVDFLQNTSRCEAACFFAPADKSLACTKRGYPIYYYCVDDADRDGLFMTIYAMATIVRTYRHARYDEYVTTAWSVWAFWVPPKITEIPLILADETFQRAQRR